MGYSKPKEIQIVHSIYWRSPHFTREDAWTFQIKGPASFYKDWLAHYKVKHPGEGQLTTFEQMKKEKPAWFAPKPIGQYEIWVIADNPDAHFWMLIDRETGEFFVTDDG